MYEDVDYERASGFFKTLGNSTRLRIVRELLQGERCVGAVEGSVQASQATVSQHLTVLKRQGIVACRKDKNMRCYSLKDPELMRRVLTLVEEQSRSAG